MLDGGSMTGTLTAMHSRTVQAVMPQFTTLDVYLPAKILLMPGRPPKFSFLYPPAVAQITLNHFRDQSQATAVLFSMRTVDPSGRASDEFLGYLTNCVYAANMARVTFALFGMPSMPIGSELGSSWCMALANVFQFSQDSILDPTEHQSPPPPSGGERDR